ncbi:MAG: hypothetical protein UW10_C0025G0002 [Candidatus Magasanikbacteria bacterium GW2011_GWA2_43_9]|nr:MAG: hypothetical protein UW10_C0025G0002 [Candidatus Magasanikbacteria bacterium GW2011_GWA2_43_9]
MVPRRLEDVVVVVARLVHHLALEQGGLGDHLDGGDPVTPALAGLGDRTGALARRLVVRAAAQEEGDELRDELRVGLLARLVIFDLVPVALGVEEVVRLQERVAVASTLGPLDDRAAGPIAGVEVSLQQLVSIARARVEPQLGEQGLDGVEDQTEARELLLTDLTPLVGGAGVLSPLVPPLLEVDGDPTDRDERVDGPGAADGLELPHEAVDDDVDLHLALHLLVELGERDVLIDRHGGLGLVGQVPGVVDELGEQVLLGLALLPGLLLPLDVGELLERPHELIALLGQVEDLLRRGGTPALLREGLRGLHDLLVGVDALVVGLDDVQVRGVVRGRGAHRPPPYSNSMKTTILVQHAQSNPFHSEQTKKHTTKDALCQGRLCKSKRLFFLLF